MTSRKYLVILGGVVIAIAMDLGSKALAESFLVPFHSVRLLNDTLSFTLVYNYGVAFGLFATNGPGVILMSSAATLLILTWLIHALRTNNYRLPSSWSMGVLLGGAAGNLIDRIFDGRVTDFIDLGLGMQRWATFNLADVFVLCGITMLVIRSFQNSDSVPPAH